MTSSGYLLAARSARWAMRSGTHSACRAWRIGSVDVTECLQAAAAPSTSASAERGQRHPLPSLRLTIPVPSPELGAVFPVLASQRRRDPHRHHPPRQRSHAPNGAQARARAVHTGRYLSPMARRRRPFTDRTMTTPRPSPHRHALRRLRRGEALLLARSSSSARAAARSHAKITRSKASGSPRAAVRSALCESRGSCGE